MVRNVPLYRQKRKFTCGPSSLMMVMSALDERYQPNETAELEIWREATTIHGGCGPVGLALALKRRGLAKAGAKLSKPRVKTKQVNTPTFDVRAALYGMLGVDLTEIHGLGPSLSLKLIGECGTDLRAWPSAKHFTSWRCLAPGNKISGGKVLSSRTRRSSSRAAALLRLAATTVGRSDTALGAFYRRLSSRAGKSKAVTATARKIAVLCYNTLRHGMPYRDPGADQYERQYRSRVLANLQRRAKSLGFVLQALPGDANPAVS
ncbi:peptidase C39 family protein [Bradyrhizobium genomosp. III]|uniref:peptidase C39 family protein n=1 Tax=Bradyrhizobium genomosp. III TaxID=2683271 RepID=UPI003F7EE728